MAKKSLSEKLTDRGWTQTRLAKGLGVTQGAVWQWLRKPAKGVPAERVLRLEKLTGLSRHEIRPDLYPLERAA